MTNDLYNVMKKIALAGIGAAALTAEKAKELVDQLVAKGEITVEQGKVLNEKLKHDIKEKVKESVTVNTYDTSAEAFIDNMKNMSYDELAAIKVKLAELDSKETTSD